MGGWGEQAGGGDRGGRPRLKAAAETGVTAWGRNTEMQRTRWEGRREKGRGCGQGENQEAYPLSPDSVLQTLTLGLPSHIWA